MSDIVRLKTVEPILFGVLKLVWEDGYKAVVDVRSVLEDGVVFEFLRRNHDRFDCIKLEQFGHYVYWLDDDGDEIELGSDSLRRRALRQAEILRLAS